MGSIYYRFKSSKTPARVNFDGTTMSVFDLKREIIIQNKMGKGTDFDLVLQHDSPGQEEYKDDKEMIPRSTSVLVRRAPPRQPGRGTAARYVADTNAAGSGTDSRVEPGFRGREGGPGSAGGGGGGGGGGWNAHSGRASMSRRFDGKDDVAPPAKPSYSSSAPPSSVSPGNEQDAIAAMFAASEQQWQETQEHMSHATPIYNNPRPQTRKPYAPREPEKVTPTPPGYICYRCGEKGHWIQDCPTNGNPDFENKPRFKRTTGIPKSFLKTVDSAGSAGRGVMITPDGSHVIAQPDSASWERHRTRPKALTAADVRETIPDDPSLVDPLSNKLLREPVKTPCCGTSYSEEHIQSHLLENDFVCPQCAEKIGSLDKLLPDTEANTRVKDYIETKIAESADDGSGKEATQEPTPPAKGTPPTGPSAATPPTGPKNATPEPQTFSGPQPPTGPAVSEAQLTAIGLMQMLQNPNLPPPQRMMLQQQLLQLNQMQQAQQQHQMMMQYGAMNPIMSGYGMGMGGMGMGNMNPMMANGFRGGFQPGYRPPAINPFPMQQPPGQDSPYDRLPVNGARRPMAGVKRARPTDFTEVQQPFKR